VKLLVILLSRLQFAFTVAFHFLFVPLTIGLILLTAIFETLHFFKKEPIYRRIADFWGELFVINFAVGIVTGLVMSVQFGTNWSAYSVFMGDVFGSPLALEALLAFFLESTFAGIWIFKRKRLSSGMRMLTVWMIVLGTSISAIWIITANGFMQHPVGYEMAADGSKVLLTDFVAVISNPYSLYMLSHTLLSAILLGAIFMIGVSAYHLKRNQHVEIFMRSVKVAVIVGLIASLLIPIEGNSYSKYIGQNDVQPLKGAILRNKIESPAQTEIKVTEGNGKESQIDANSAATLDSAAADLQKLDRKPPVKAIYFGFMLMQGLGFFFIAFFAILFIRRKLLLENKFIQNLAIWTMPLPYIAITVGWFVAEVGRQPWMVYNLMTVEAGVSDVPVGAVIFSLFTLVVFYAILFAIDFYLLRKKVIEGPEEEGGDYHVAA
jgi:cytochrome d ubiquinol oxidase subunit I